jgi:hypothetical protein
MTPSPLNVGFRLPVARVFNADVRESVLLFDYPPHTRQPECLAARIATQYLEMLQ